MPTTRIETLADEYEAGPLWTAHCDHCVRSVEMDPLALIERFGADYPMAALRRRVSCSECGAQGVPVVRVHCASSGVPK